MYKLGLALAVEDLAAEHVVDPCNAVVDFTQWVTTATLGTSAQTTVIKYPSLSINVIAEMDPFADTTSNMYVSVDENEDLAPVGEVDEKTDQIARDFVTKFANQTIDSRVIERISRSPDAVALMALPASKIWVVAMVSMSIETFYAMRFMCLSLQEFTDMVTLGNINEIRQVYSTLNIRMEQHVDSVRYGDDVEERNMFGIVHPSVFMIQRDNPETDTMATMYALMR